MYQTIVVFCRGLGDEDCKDVTVGSCSFDANSIIQVVDIFTEVDQCQYYCTALDNCAVFRFDGTKCQLLTKDYRKDCKITGGPFVSVIFTF